MQILSSSLFPVGQTNFQIPIANALKAGTKIFVFFLAAVDMGNLLIQGHDAGLFVEGTQIIAGDAGMIRVVWANMPVGTVTTYMKGILGFAPASDYSTPQGQKFLKSYIKTNITTADPITGICNNETDDSGEYLYKSILDPAHPTTYTCSGFNSSAYNADGSNLDIYIPYAYDATLAIAMAIHVVLYNQKKSLTGKAIYAALINNVSFSGISGAVNFSRALTTDSTRYAEGDRRTGVRYNILNFNSAVYDSDPQGASGFVSVGHWTKESGNVITAPIMYSTADNSPPSDIPPLINQTITVFFIIILQTLGTLLFITITFVAGILIAFRKTRLLKAIQLRMQAMIIIGGLLGSARVITGFLPVSDINCSLNVWLGHLAFWFIFCPMMLKTWRVHKIVNNKTLKRVKVTENSSVIIFLCVLAPIVFYLAILQSLHAFTPIRITKTFIVGIQYYSDQQCSARHFGKYDLCTYSVFFIAY